MSISTPKGSLTIVVLILALNGVVSRGGQKGRSAREVSRGSQQGQSAVAVSRGSQQG